MTLPVQTDPVSFNDDNSNTSASPSFDDVLRARLSRRGVLRGSIGGAASAGAASRICGAGRTASTSSASGRAAAFTS